MKWFRQTQAPALMKWIKIKPIFSDTIEMDWVSLGVMKPQMCITLEKKMLLQIVFGCQLSAAGILCMSVYTAWLFTAVCPGKAQVR